MHCGVLGCQEGPQIMQVGEVGDLEGKVASDAAIKTEPIDPCKMLAQ